MNEVKTEKNAYFHLPGLFEFYDFYKAFLRLYKEHGEYFYEWAHIGSIYGSPQDCLWGGGRVENGEVDADAVISLMREYGISSRLTFSNSLLTNEHLNDKKCNELCKIFEGTDENRESDPQNGVIIYSYLLLDYIKKTYPNFYFVSSTTKVLTKFEELVKEVEREEYSFVVPDFRLNKSFDNLSKLSDTQKDKIEFLCNECCDFDCKDRKNCYEAVSRLNLGIESEEHHCSGRNGALGYRFSKAMENPGFISMEDIKDIYLPMGFTNFKIEGRGLGSALLLEFILYYMTKPQYHIHVREALYLDNMLDLF